ncbi:hypothetical protein QBC46DRAFT_378994 [Diplogelasinospora grovesii]|uniref:Uncharacterized protein n=1 Tax=Diplogelasinospora grovesii TaxID=303347 RepID=A0AAN6S743_9PEZI|nr:hypothetical protein QBC46DRAFT_378994 [Diplogelasinospora grovesii]
MPSIASDTDLPKSLNRVAKRVKRARQLVSAHLGSPSRRVDNPPIQGMFSRTLFLTLKDNREVVVQFRTEPLDLSAFQVARDILGDVVPTAQVLPDPELESESAWAYCFNRLPGTVWVRGVAGKGVSDLSILRLVVVSSGVLPRDRQGFQPRLY